MKDQVYIFSAPRSFGGGEVFLVRLAELLSMQFQYVVVSPALPALRCGVEKAGGRFVELAGAGGIALRLAFVAWLWQHRRDLREKAASFVLNGRGAAYFAPLVRFVIGIGPVVICHTEVAARKANLKDFLYGAALRFARCSVAVSDITASQHSKRWPSLDVRAIPNWIDSAAPSAAPAAPRTGAPTTQVAVVGRLVDTKGIVDVASVFAAMDGFEAHFYGEGPLREYLDTMASTTSALKMHGHVDDLSARLPAHTILLSASYSESFSYSVAEGIQAGLLCVVSGIAAHRELLGPDYPETLYFSPGDREGLRRALDAAAYLLKDSGGQGAREAISRAYVRMCRRNGPDVARAAYRAVLLGTRPSGDGHSANIVAGSVLRANED